MDAIRPLDPLQLTGRRDDHVEPVPGTTALRLHPAAVGPWLALQAAAAQSGLRLQAVSGFRDFGRQRFLWNAKCRGERPALDRDGRPVDVLALSPAEIVDTVLHWSALPGASRHHWGSELDVIDLSAWPQGLPWRLETSDFLPGAPCAALHDWLEREAAAFGFFRPYARDLGGVQPEPWHISYAPVSVPATAALSTAVLAGALQGGEVEHAQDILSRLHALHARQVLAIEGPPAPLAAGLTATWETRPS